MLFTRAVAAHAASHRALRFIAATAQRTSREVEAAAHATVLARARTEAAEAAGSERSSKALAGTLRVRVGNAAIPNVNRAAVATRSAIISAWTATCVASGRRRGGNTRVALRATIAVLAMSSTALRDRWSVRQTRLELIATLGVACGRTLFACLEAVETSLCSSLRFTAAGA
jgi:hypothetical protein